MTLHQFNPGKKSWKIYGNTLTSISGDDLKISPSDGNDLILEVSANKQIIFKQGATSYNLVDLSNVASSGSSSGIQNGDDVSFGNVDISETLILNDSTIIYNDNIFAATAINNSSGWLYLENNLYNYSRPAISFGYDNSYSAMIFDITGNNNCFSFEYNSDYTTFLGTKQAPIKISSLILSEYNSANTSSISINESSNNIVIESSAFEMNCNLEMSGNINTNANITMDGTINSVYIKSNLTNFTNSMAIVNHNLSNVSDAINNTFFGFDSGASLTTGDSNVGIGTASLYSNNSGYNNVAIGHESLMNNTSGNNNIGIGYRSLFSAGSNGIDNIAIGSEALESSNGKYNIAIGSKTLEPNTGGWRNVAMGYNSMVNATGGSDCVAIGFESLKSSTNGENNVAIGAYAGDNLTTGDYNIYIGHSCKAGSATNNNEIVIGRNTTGNGSNTVTIGNSSVTHTYLSGNITTNGRVGIGTTSPDGPLNIYESTGTSAGGSGQGTLVLEHGDTNGKSSLTFVSANNRNYDYGAIEYNSGSSGDEKSILRLIAENNGDGGYEDQVRIRINGSDRYTFESNEFNVLDKYKLKNDQLKIENVTSNVPIYCYNSGNNNCLIVVDSNKTLADSMFGGLAGNWNGERVATLYFNTGSDTTNKDDGYITFETKVSGSSRTEVVRITSDGKLGIGTTSPSEMLDVNGNIRVNEIYCNKIISANDNNCYFVFQDGNGGDGIYEIWMHSDGATSHNLVQDKANGETMIRGKGVIVHSDDRLKHNEKYINNSLDIIKKLNPYTYDMTNKFYDASYVGDISGIYYHRAGFIAQQIREIQEISFCSIGEEYDSSNNPIPMGIDYNSLFTYNVAATKELHIIVNNQQNTINELNTKVQSLEYENLLIKSALNELLSEAGKSTV